MAAFVAGVMLAGCGAAAHQRSATGQPPAAAAKPAAAKPAPAPAPPGPCAQRAPTTLPAEAWLPARRQLAPAGATAIRLCRYAGLNGSPRLGLVSSRLITSAGLVAELVREFDTLPSMPPGAFSCPADDGSQIAASLRYGGGQNVTISVGLTGCRLVSNGSVHRTAAGDSGSQLVTQLEHLLAPPVSGAGTLAHGHWAVLARSPVGPQRDATVAWDGDELLELAGRSGAAYDPARARWRNLPPAPAGVPATNAAEAWTGRQWFVFGGAPASRAILYDPSSNRWSTTEHAPAAALRQPVAVWTGTRVILAGLGHGTVNAASYDPATGAWSSLNPPISPSHPPLGVAMADTGDGVLLWSLWGSANHSGVDVFRLHATGGWVNVTGSWPQHETVSDPVFTGSRVLLAPGQIWCGLCSHPAPFDAHGYLVDPATLQLTAIPHGPLDDLGPQTIWADGSVVALNTQGELTGPKVSVLPGDIAFWSAGGWTRGPRAPEPLSEAPAAWTGSELLVLAAGGRLLSYG